MNHPLDNCLREIEWLRAEWAKSKDRIEALEAENASFADDLNEAIARIEELEAVPDLREECANLQYMKGVYEERIAALEGALRRIAFTSG